MNPTNPAVGGYGQPDPLQQLIALLQGFAFQSGLGGGAETNSPFGGTSAVPSGASSSGSGGGGGTGSGGGTSGGIGSFGVH